MISGTNIYFNELNRHRHPAGPADGLAWSVNPQIHAFDDLSLMENLQAQPDTIATARFFAPGTALFVTPITLRPRFNAVAVTDARSSFDGGLPWQVDVRQPSLFGAAWTLGSIAALAGAGADGLTYYDTVGPAGVIESPAGSPAPAEFFSRPDTPYPLAVVLADAARLGGRAGLPRHRGSIRPASPRSRSARSRTAPRSCWPTSPPGPARSRVALPAGRRRRRRPRLRILDEHTAEAAAADLPVLPAHRPARHPVTRRSSDRDPESIRHRAAGRDRWLTGGGPGSGRATGCRRCTASTGHASGHAARPPR